MFVYFRRIRTGPGKHHHSVYNGEEFLARAIESVWAQNYRPLEVIVVDDGSSDGTASVARRWPEVRYLYQPNQGHGTAKNTGIARARGEYLAFLDADDWWKPEKLRLQVERLRSHPEAGYVICHARYVLECGATNLPASSRSFCNSLRRRFCRARSWFAEPHWRPWVFLILPSRTAMIQTGFSVRRIWDFQK